MTFTSPEVGYVVAVGNYHFGGETSVIRETTDGGVTWRPIWTGHDLTLSWIGQAGGNLVALGERSPQTQEDNAALLPDGQPVPFEPVTVTSTDRGATWSVADSTIPPGAQNELLVADFATPTTGLAVPDPAYFQYDNRAGHDDPAQMLRTTDGGRTWTIVTLPGGVPSGGAAFTSPTTGFVTGYPRPREADCQGELWKTIDSGQTWAAQPATCEPFGLAGISFPTPSVGYAVGQGRSTTVDQSFATVIATDDGGTTWSLRYASPPVPGDRQGFSITAFPTTEDGYALAATCTGTGGQGSCGGPLWATSDGGRTWTQTTAFGARLSAPAPGQAHVVGGFS